MLTNSFVIHAKEFELEAESAKQSKVERYIKFTFDKIKFNKVNKLSFAAFRNGFYGYLNMIEAGKINAGSLLSICDFTLSSNVKRLWVIDIKNKKVLFNTLVAHGMATGEEFATSFSNIEESHQTSLGFYTTGETYDGNNGYSLKLNGVDGSFNNKAYDRAIVIHAAEYVSREFAEANKRIGRSHGCPALPVEVAPKIIDKIKNGSCLFIYHNTKSYLTSSYWLRNKIKQLPQEADKMDLQINAFNNPRYVESNESNKTTDNDVINNNSISNATPSSEKKASSPDKNAPKIISSIIIVNEKGANGVADTVIVK